MTLFSKLHGATQLWVDIRIFDTGTKAASQHSFWPTCLFFNIYDVVKRMTDSVILALLGPPSSCALFRCFVQSLLCLISR